MDGRALGQEETAGGGVAAPAAFALPSTQADPGWRPYQLMRNITWPSRPPGSKVLLGSW